MSRAVYGTWPAEFLFSESVRGICVKLRNWYAVHGTIEVIPPPAAMLDSIRPKVNGLEHDFEISDGHWRKACFRLLDSVAPAILVHRILPGEDGFLPDLEGWKDNLNMLPDEPHRDYVLEHIHNTRQTVSLMPISALLGHSRLARICEQLCGYVARASEGLIHVYQEGFFSPEGESLWPHCPRHRLKTR